MYESEQMKQILELDQPLITNILSTIFTLKNSKNLQTLFQGPYSQHFIFFVTYELAQ